MPTGKPLLVTFFILPVFVKVTSRVNNVLFKMPHARKVKVNVLRGH